MILPSRSVGRGGGASPRHVFDREEPVVAATWPFVSGSQTSLWRGLPGNPGWSHRWAASALPGAGWEMIYRRVASAVNPGGRTGPLNRNRRETWRSFSWGCAVKAPRAGRQRGTIRAKIKAPHFNVIDFYFLCLIQALTQKQVECRKGSEASRTALGEPEICLFIKIPSVFQQG